MYPTWSEWLEFLLHDVPIGAFWIWVLVASVFGTGQILSNLAASMHWPPDQVVLGAIVVGLVLVWSASTRSRQSRAH